jgi:two-component system response regulator
LLSYSCALAQCHPREVAAQVPTTEKTILLVDDDPVVANLAVRRFKAQKPHVTLKLATDGIAACQYIEGTGPYADRASHPNPDLILLDINLPRFTGLEFLLRLRELAPPHAQNIPVIILTSSGSRAEIECARNLGASHFFPKPIRWLDLWQTIESACIMGRQD